MSVEEFKRVSGASAEPIGPDGTFNASRRNRAWPARTKAAIVAESYAGESVRDVARRHGILPQHIYKWRRTARGALPLAPFATDAKVRRAGRRGDARPCRMSLVSSRWRSMA